MRQQHFVPFLIRVGNKSENESYIDPTIPLSIRVMMLKSAWQKLHESGCHITAKTVEYIARKYRITNGKWLFFSSGGAKIDYLWKLVCKGIKSATIKATRSVRMIRMQTTLNMLFVSIIMILPTKKRLLHWKSRLGKLVSNATFSINPMLTHI